MKKFDAILVLGVDTDQKLFKARVDKCVYLFNKGVASKIIFSGRYWGGLKIKPKNTEAELMAKYAMNQGVSRKGILLEERSLNTAGNFYFTKKQILEPQRITKLLVITQPNHFPKAKYLAKKILGKNYKLTWISDGTERKGIPPGHTGLKEVKRAFQNIKDGDTKKVAELLRKHPHYKKYRKI